MQFHKPLPPPHIIILIRVTYTLILHCPQRSPGLPVPVLGSVVVVLCAPVQVHIHFTQPIWHSSFIVPAGCYEHSDPTMVFSSESCPYACTTCSDCNGFGFAPSTPSQNSVGLLNGGAAPPFNTWPQPTFTQALPSYASTSATLSNPTSSPSGRCGGSCQCSAENLSCQCASECCGCCFGCTCSDSGSVGTTTAQEDTRERLGFAVSGERGSCCTESKPYGRDRCNKPQEEEDSASRKKRRRAENIHDEGDEVPLQSLQPMGALPAASSDGGTLDFQDLNSVSDILNIVGDVMRDGP